MGCLIAIDPGKMSGAARFDLETGLLLSAVAVKGDEIALAPAAPAIVCLVELPVIYPGERSKNPNDLIGLAVLVGCVQRCYRRSGALVHLVKPRTWKGTAPKKICCARTVAALRPEELAILPMRPRAKDYDHNMLDAIGLGLWWLKKEGKRT